MPSLLSIDLVRCATQTHSFEPLLNHATYLESIVIAAQAHGVKTEDQFACILLRFVASSPINLRKGSGATSCKVFLDSNTMLHFSRNTSETLREESWGQFVCPEEAENTIIRSSKILSKRFSLN